MSSSELKRPPTVRPRLRQWSVRVVLASVLATGLAYFPYRLLDGSGARRASELKAQYERTRAASQALKAENAQLRRQIVALESDQSALTDIARNELGMVFPDELIIRIDRQGEP